MTRKTYTPRPRWPARLEQLHPPVDDRLQAALLAPDRPPMGIDPDMLVLCVCMLLAIITATLLVLL